MKNKRPLMLAMQIMKTRLMQFIIKIERLPKEKRATYGWVAERQDEKGETSFIKYRTLNEAMFYNKNNIIREIITGRKHYQDNLA